MTIYIFGYGSLINTKYVKELKNISRNRIPVYINNLLRHWILCSNNGQYFGVYDKNNYKTNGILLEVDQEELIKLDKREKYYTRHILNHDRIIYYNDDNIIDVNDIVYIYYPHKTRAIKTMYKKNKQSENYLIKCLSGCLKINQKFFIDFLKTTYG